MVKSLAIHTITGTDITDCESNRDSIDERKVGNAGRKGRSDGNAVTGNCEGDKMKAVIDTNEVQEIDLDAKADVEQSSGNKGNKGKKNCHAKVQTLKGLELDYDNDFNHKRQIDINPYTEAQNSFKLLSNRQFDNLRSHWTNKCDQVQLERELAPDEQLAPVENCPDVAPLGDQSAPSRYSEVETVPTSRAAEYFAQNFTVDCQDDEITYLMKGSPWSEQSDTNLQRPCCGYVEDQQDLPTEDHYNLQESVVTEPCYEGENEDMAYSRYFSGNMNNNPFRYRQEEMLHRYRRNEDISADDDDNIERPVTSMYFQSN